MASDVMAQAHKAWKRLGVAPETADEMAAELSADLAAAAADGRSPEEYVGGDAAALARIWAAERGAVRPRRYTGTVATAALIGALPGGFTGLFWVFAFDSSTATEFLFGNRAESYSPPSWAVLVLYLFGAVAAYGGSLAGVSAVLRYRADPCRRPTVRALAALIPVIGLLATAAGIGLAAALDFQYSAFRPVSLTVLVVVGTGVAVTRAAVVSHELGSRGVNSPPSGPGFARRRLAALLRAGAGGRTARAVEGSDGHVDHR